MTIHELFDLIKNRGYDCQIDGNSISAGDSLYLGSLTSLPEGVSLSAGGYLDLSRLTSLPEGVSLSAGGMVHGRLNQSWRGLTLRSFDGIVSVVLGNKKVGEIDIYKCEYFCGENTGDNHYVACRGDLAAHGKTIREAMDDLNEKLQERVESSEAVARIRESGMVTVADYRAITGACREGCRQWLHSHGLEGVESLPVGDVIRLLNGAYGADTFRRAIVEAAR